ncbi:MAG TPA: RNA 2',3'-cyclic phosphodiesterase [Candidatus Limnocylindrales bacterium]|nr:RNA 2',3'-cyclic phosphodiesterase [Candidatus Limnocylindrales bacterium]
MTPRATGLIRSFAAILLSEDVRAAVASAVEPLRGLSRAVAWVPAGNLHFTLRFLGNQDQDGLARAVEALGDAAAATSPFTLALHGMGGFPGLERPRILWVGATEGALEARALQARLEAALDRRGFGREDRAWHPHVTVGRVFDNRRWREDRGLELRGGMAGLAARGFGAFPVSRISLMRSDLLPGGARYRELAQIALGDVAPR